jgi:hypothetical protein
MRVDWRIAGEEIGHCNCDWGCPCQFNARPTHGRCEALVTYLIEEGHYASESLDGVVFASIYSWPGAIHEGGGTHQAIIDERATPQQRAAVAALLTGTQGGALFEIFAAVCPHQRETLIAPIHAQVDRERRVASVRIEGVGEAHVEPHH